MLATFDGVATLVAAAMMMHGPALTAVERASANPRPANAPSQRPALVGQADASQAIGC